MNKPEDRGNVRVKQFYVNGRNGGMGNGARSRSYMVETRKVGVNVHVERSYVNERRKSQGYLARKQVLGIRKREQISNLAIANEKKDIIHFYGIFNGNNIGGVKI